MYRRLWIAFCLTLALLAVFAGAVAAQTGTKQVALVIALPNNQVHSQVVTVPMTATAFDALGQASVKLVSTNGSFGPAICSINDTGCPSTDCFCDKSHFWAYYHLDANTGKWVASQEGVGAYKPADGAVEGFIWSGVDANYNPTDQPPVLTFDQAKAGASAGQGAAAPAVQSAASVTSTKAAPPAALPTTGGSPAGSTATLLFALGGLLLLAAGFLTRRGGSRA